jgi:hypothetical protein
MQAGAGDVLIGASNLLAAPSQMAFATMLHWGRPFLGRNRSQIASSARFTKTRPSTVR